MSPLLLADTRAVPDIVGPALSVSAADKTADLWWSGVRERTVTPEPSSAVWSGAGLGAFIAPCINDLDLGAIAFQWLSGAGSSRLSFNDAAGRDFCECRVTVDTAVAPVIQPTLQWSNDGAAWTTITTTVQVIATDPVWPDLTTYVYRWSSVGTKPYWSLMRASGTDATAFTEVWFREQGDTFNDVREILVFDVATGTRSLLARVRSDDPPTTTKRLSVASAIKWTEADTSSTANVSLMVVVVRASDGRESEGVAVSASDVDTFASRYVTSVGGNAGAVSSGTIAAMAPVQSVGGAVGAVSSDSIAAMVQVLAKPNALAAIGGRVLIGPATKLTSAVTTVATSIAVAANVLTNGDHIVLQKVVAGVQQTEHMLVTSASSGSGPYTYSVTRNRDGSGADAWAVDDVVTSTVSPGSGFWDFYTARGLFSASELGPALVASVRNSATWNDCTPRVVLGNLNGKFGYATDIFGLAVGVPTGAWVKVDPTNGVRIGHNATTKMALDASGNASFTGAITVGSGIIGGFTIDADRLSASGLRLNAGGTAATTYIGVGSPFSYNNASTKFFADGTGKFSLGQAFVWDGTNWTLQSAHFRLSDNGLEALSGGTSYGGFEIMGTTGVQMRSGAYNLFVDAAAGEAGTNTDFKCHDLIGRTTIGTWVKLLGTQGAAVAAVASVNATDLASVITLANEMKAQFNTLRSRIQTHGIIAT